MNDDEVIRQRISGRSARAIAKAQDQDADPARPWVRDQAPADRHELFRDFQPQQRSSRGCQAGDLDTIVFATGFDALTGPLLALNIAGSKGYELKEAWATGPRTYLGLQTPHFPNLFTITGPGSPSVLCNMPIAIKQHVDWITNCIRDMRAKGLKRIKAEPDAAERWVESTRPPMRRCCRRRVHPGI
jgi:cation diffusion facilitator CzcD-associated flavoprotein CzcO